MARSPIAKTSTVAVEHGPDVVCYAGGVGDPYYQPFLKCLCWWSLRDAAWETVGRAFDEHLEEP